MTECKTRSSSMSGMGDSSSGKLNRGAVHGGGGGGGSVVVWSLMAWFVVRTLPEIWEHVVAKAMGLVKEGSVSVVDVDHFPSMASTTLVDVENFPSTLEKPTADEDYMYGAERSGSVGILEFLGGKLLGGLRYLLEAFVKDVASSTIKCWLVLLVAIFTESGATALSKLAMVDSSPSLLAMSCVLVIVSQCFMTASLARIDVGIAYAIWAAIGTGAVSLAGVLFFNEDCDTTKVISLTLIVLGVVGLSLGESSST